METITLCFGTVVGGRSEIRLMLEEGTRVLCHSTGLHANENAPTPITTAASEPLHTRFVRYLDDAHRDGVIGNARYAVAIGKARKLQRFLSNQRLRRR